MICLLQLFLAKVALSMTTFTRLQQASSSSSPLRYAATGIILVTHVTRLTGVVDTEDGIKSPANILGALASKLVVSRCTKAHSPGNLPGPRTSLAHIVGPLVSSSGLLISKDFQVPIGDV